jgi:hypothetical protein
MTAAGGADIRALDGNLGIEIPQRSNGLPCRDVLSLFGGTQRFATSQLG